ncbi:TPA: hypothetical protein ACP3ZG_000675 [Pseudomonas aeruginosa]|uniref:Uncharacterized protein n=1 Tax=Pseudomonas aeruginosa TaxID=287 RepID=A0A241XR89_PSEAI|nr:MULTISPECIES: hypothetical protein [Pseudomonas]MBI8857405.1 hypothetical protein [Pseudomonas aeruginosa]OBY60313.1 hypothetical protein A9513_000350 [Pseudomonas sp. AU12215]OTI62934.1 hypothetical protein CAZ10_08775 [Pseudomonas aeruginosa]HDU2624890.1 hypothetical protein [Pseudomonas aeruginosa]
MVRYIIAVCLTALLILLSIAGLIVCAFGVLNDVDHVVALQTACYIGLIVPLYFLSRSNVGDLSPEDVGRANPEVHPNEA